MAVWNVLIRSVAICNGLLYCCVQFFWEPFIPNNFILNTALPWVLGNTPASCCARSVPVWTGPIACSFLENRSSKQSLFHLAKWNILITNRISAQYSKSVKYLQCCTVTHAKVMLFWFIVTQLMLTCMLANKPLTCQPHGVQNIATPFFFIIILPAAGELSLPRDS